MNRLAVLTLALTLVVSTLPLALIRHGQRTAGFSRSFWRIGPAVALFVLSWFPYALGTGYALVVGSVGWALVVFLGFLVVWVLFFLCLVYHPPQKSLAEAAALSLVLTAPAVVNDFSMYSPTRQAVLWLYCVTEGMVPMLAIWFIYRVRA